MIFPVTLRNKHVFLASGNIETSSGGKNSVCPHQFSCQKLLRWPMSWRKFENVIKWFTVHWKSISPVWFRVPSTWKACFDIRSCQIHYFNQFFKDVWFVYIGNRPAFILNQPLCKICILLKGSPKELIRCYQMLEAESRRKRLRAE